MREIAEKIAKRLIYKYPQVDTAVLIMIIEDAMREHTKINMNIRHEEARNRGFLRGD